MMQKALHQVMCGYLLLLFRSDAKLTPSFIGIDLGGSGTM